MKSMKKIDNKHMHCLFSEPSFSEGVSRLVDFQGIISNRYEKIIFSKNVDCVGIENDWKVVGHDMFESIEKYEQEEKKEQTSLGLTYA